MPGWEIRQVEKLLVSLFVNDTTIKNAMGGTTRVSVNSVVSDPENFPYIYIYFVFGPDARVNGNRRIQTNVDAYIEVRTIGAPTDNSVAVIERIDALMIMKQQLTPNGNLMVSSAPLKPINIAEQGESPERYYMRQGHSYKLQICAV